MIGAPIGWAIGDELNVATSTTVFAEASFAGVGSLSAYVRRNGRAEALFAGAGLLAPSFTLPGGQVAARFAGAGGLAVTTGGGGPIYITFAGAGGLRFKSSDLATALLHLDGADGSTTFTDEKGHTWTAHGNAQIDTALSKFGGASALFDGTGDWIDTPDAADWYLGSNDFTIEMWFYLLSGAADPDYIFLAGQCDATGGGSANSAWFIHRTGNGDTNPNKIRGELCTGSGSVTVTGTTSFSAASGNQNEWHHVRFIRVGNVLRLFIDGVQEDADIAFTGSVPNATGIVAIGRAGDFATGFWQGKKKPIPDPE